MRGKYGDIIGMPPPEPKNHIRMSRQSRAAQFSPFAALTGYDSMVDEEERTTEKTVFLDEEKKEEINYILSSLISCPEASGRAEVHVTYFVPDGRKAGGRYEKVSGPYCYYMTDERVLVIGKNMETKIFIDDITDMECSFFVEE